MHKRNIFADFIGVGCFDTVQLMEFLTLKSFSFTSRIEFPEKGVFQEQKPTTNILEALSSESCTDFWSYRRNEVEEVTFWKAVGSSINRSKVLKKFV